MPSTGHEAAAEYEQKIREDRSKQRPLHHFNQTFVQSKDSHDHFNGVPERRVEQPTRRLADVDC